MSLKLKEHELPISWITTINKNLEEFSKQENKPKLSFALSYKLGRIMDETSSIAKRFNSEKDKLIIEKYGEKQKNGQFAVTNPNKLASFKMEVEAIQKNTESLRLPELDMEDFRTLEAIPVQMMKDLSPLIPYSGEVTAVKLSYNTLFSAVNGLASTLSVTTDPALAHLIGNIVVEVESQVNKIRTEEQQIAASYGEMNELGRWIFKSKEDEKDFIVASDALKEREEEMNFPKITYDMITASKNADDFDLEFAQSMFALSIFDD